MRDPVPMPALRFVVNPASGGRTGNGLARELATLHPGSVHRLPGDDLDLVARRCRDAGEAMVACGGDGTVCACFSAAWRADAQQPPAVGILPLGTGNDLARHLGWNLRLRLEDRLLRLGSAAIRTCDRWTIAGPGVTRDWYGYLGLGYDAAVAGRFHAWRSAWPRWLAGGVVNKTAYAVAGLVSGSERLDQVVDPPPPPGTRCLVWASIASYASGCRLGPAIRDDDRRCDPFALPGPPGFGLVIAGLSPARALPPGGSFRFTLARPVPMQVDGEPFLASAGTWTIAHAGAVRVLVPA